MQTITSEGVRELFAQLRPVLGERDWRLVGTALDVPEAEKLTEELGRQGHQVSARKVGELLHQQGYSLQANRRTEEGSAHPDRNAKCEHIQPMALNFQEQGQPVVSVDTRRKELVGSFKNAGQE